MLPFPSSPSCSFSSRRIPCPCGCRTGWRGILGRAIRRTDRWRRHCRRTTCLNGMKIRCRVRMPFRPPPRRRCWTGRSGEKGPSAKAGRAFLPREGEVYYFPDFPQEYAEAYDVAAEGTGAFVRVPVLTLELENGMVISLPVLNPEYQGGVRDLDCRLGGGYSALSRHHSHVRPPAL